MGVNHVAAYEIAFSAKMMCHFLLKTHTKEVLNPLDRECPVKESLMT